MKVLMIGWEYPPHISGGLGTACEGLTRGLARVGVEIVFVVPHLMGGEKAAHMRLLDSTYEADIIRKLKELDEKGLRLRQEAESLLKVDTRQIPAALSPYWNAADFEDYLGRLSGQQEVVLSRGVDLDEDGMLLLASEAAKQGLREHYGKDIFEAVKRFSDDVLLLALRESYDIIHCHDWMTYPAGVAARKIKKKPLVVHVHSLECDRSGKNADPRIEEIEAMGMRMADMVVAVSYYTRNMINARYGIPLDKIKVVHNGIYRKHVVDFYKTKWNSTSKVVLFLGRITYQKGPEYFVEVAPRVIPHVPDVLFVMAGNGDMLPKLAQRVNELGINKHFQFTGFLREKEVEKIFSVADLYVMPSVSEPFGISALEAIDYDTPALISKQSGVAEVLQNALKFDFWDLDRLGDLIINGLLHEDLRADMVNMAKRELERLHWDASGGRMREIYELLFK